jgi:hypothetical protein
MGHARDRRATVRYPVIDHRAILAWEDGHGHRQVDARIVNLSQSGILLAAECSLPEGRQPVWLRLQEPRVTDWVDAVVLRTSRSLKLRLTGRGTCLARLQFLPTCPYDFFKCAVHGLSDDETPRESGTSDYEIGVWR